MNGSLEFTIWFVPSLIGNAVAVSFVGLVLGPMYPIIMSQAGRIITRKVRLHRPETNLT
jgi:fucose permease